jgi:hypothetical protein
MAAPVKTIPQPQAKDAGGKEFSVPVLLPTEKCAVVERDGSATVVFRIEPTEWKRYKTRIGTMDPADYLWDNVLKRSIVDHVW